MKTEKKMVMFDDPTLVEYRTDLEGWTGPDGKYYGKGESGERMARYANSTHTKCECGNLIKKGYSRCSTCSAVLSKANYLKLEEIEWDGKSMLCLRHDDKFFTDMDDVHEYCEMEDVKIEDLELMHCEKIVNISQINIDEMNEEYCTEDESLSDFHPEIAKKVDELNELIKNTEPKIWFQTNKRIKLTEDDKRIN